MPQEFVDAERKIKKFRKYTIGYLHIDVLYAPKIDKKRWYLFTSIDRVSTKKVHPFTNLCRKRRIEHRRIKFRHPWTNGMIERFNGKIKKNVLRKYLFNDVDDLKEKLTEYINDYNFTIRLKGLGYKTTVDYLKTNFGHSI